MSQLKTNSIVDASGGNTATINGVAPNVNNIRGKNKIINGNFDVWQRGTGAFTTNDAYTADRWQIVLASATMSNSQSSFTLGQTDVPNEPKFYSSTSVTTASVAGEYAIYRQKVESVRTFAGQTVTLSFWAKADASKDIAVEFAQYFGGGGSPSATVYVSPVTFSLTTSWQKFEATISIPSISGKTLGSNNDDWLEMNFWLSAGSNFNARTNSLGNQSGTFDIAQVQLEAGDTASGFETLSYGETLAMCQRYYVRVNGSGGVGPCLGAGATTSGANYYVMFKTPVMMRAVPTASYSQLIISDSLNYDLAVTSMSVGATSQGDYLYLNGANAATSVANRPCNMRTAFAAPAAYLALDAEL